MHINQGGATCLRHRSAGMQSKLTSYPAFYPRKSENESNGAGVASFPVFPAHGLTPKGLNRVNGRLGGRRSGIEVRRGVAAHAQLEKRGGI